MVKSPKNLSPESSPPKAMTVGDQPSFLQKWSKMALLFLAVALPLAVFYTSAAPLSLSLPIPSVLKKYGWLEYPLRRNSTASPPVPLVNFASPPLPKINFASPPVPQNKEEDSLQRVLKEAAMGDKTVILTTLNGAWASPNSILDVFIESFRIGEGTPKLLEHLVMVALDKKAYDRCKSIHRHCFALTDDKEDFSGEKDFMTDGYLKMMWRRIDFLREVLEMGYNFIFSDTDIVWFRNPMPHFHPEGDFQIACDQFNGNELDLHNRPNGGYNYVKSNDRTVKFYKFWYESRLKFPGLHDQDVLNQIKFDPFVKSLGIKMRFLDTAYFGGICEKSKDFNKVCTMHANCCIGLSRKIDDLKVMLDDWRAYMSLSPERKQSTQHKWNVPKNCSFAPVHHL